MKKIISILMFLGLLIALCGCGNMSMWVGNFEFEKIHIDTYNYSGCLTVVNWHDNTTGIEVKTKETGSIYCSEGTYFLIESECPFCDN